MELFSDAWWDNYKSLVSKLNEKTNNDYPVLNQNWLLHVINRNLTRDEYKEILEKNNIKYTENQRGFKFREILEIKDGNEVIRLFPEVLVLKVAEFFSQALIFTNDNIEEAKIIQDIFERSASWKMISSSFQKTEFINIDKTISISFSQFLGGEFHDTEEYEIYFKWQ